jgi:uncharacterized membrane protein
MACARTMLCCLAALTLGACSYDVRLSPAPPYDATTGGAAGSFAPYAPQPPLLGIGAGSPTDAEAGEPSLPGIGLGSSTDAGAGEASGGTNAPMSPPGPRGMPTILTGSPEGSFIFFDLDFQPAFMSAKGDVVVGTRTIAEDAKLWRAGPPATEIVIGAGLQLAGVSASGDVLVGTINAPSDCLETGGAEAVTWSGFMFDLLGRLSSNEKEWSFASGISADGSVVVGTSGIGDETCSGIVGGPVHPSGFWTSGGRLKALRAPEAGVFSEGLAVSRDGSTALGVSFDSDGQGSLFTNGSNSSVAAITGKRVSVQLTEGGVQVMAGVLNAFISADGSVVAGTVVDAQAGSASVEWRAFRWTRRDGIGLLPLLSGMVASSVIGLSADGATEVGSEGDPSSQLLSETNVAVRWTETSGVEVLGSKSPTSPYIINADATVIVGRGATPTVWDDTSSGVQLFADAPKFGERCPAPIVSAISDDGLTLAGVCSHDGAGWIAQRISR